MSTKHLALHTSGHLALHSSGHLKLFSPAAAYNMTNYTNYVYDGASAISTLDAISIMFSLTSPSRTYTNLFGRGESEVALKSAHNMGSVYSITQNSGDFNDPVLTSAMVFQLTWNDNRGYSYPVTVSGTIGTGDVDPGPTIQPRLWSANLLSTSFVVPSYTAGIGSGTFTIPIGTHLRKYFWISADIMPWTDTGTKNGANSCYGGIHWTSSYPTIVDASTL
jgi:hypothetical protein